MLNRDFFFDQVRRTLFDGKLKQAQFDGLNAIVTEWEQNHSDQDDRWLAYMLATTHHETGRTMQPIEEWGKGAKHSYGKADPQTGQRYYGRGFVQLTWKYNYKKAGDELGVDLVNNPAKALDLGIATNILFAGMIKGWFTGKKLADCFGPGKEDWRNARRIINGLDKADLIASQGRAYYAAISYKQG
jgi:putative chitinase